MYILSWSSVISQFLHLRGVLGSSSGRTMPFFNGMENLYFLYVLTFIFTTAIISVAHEATHLCLKCTKMFWCIV